MYKFLGTHNSGTFSKLVWWQRPFGFLLNLFSRCQTLSIKEQLEKNVRVFNLQVAFYKGEWVFSHGLCIYKEKLFDALEVMREYSEKHNCDIYYQLYLDKNFLIGQNETEFEILVNLLKSYSEKNRVLMLTNLVEGKGKFECIRRIDLEEHYWTLGWAKLNKKNIFNFLPLLKRHAKKYNKKYIKECNHEYLMLDYIEIE
jgi:hypothetical protein